jgi:hypothetical protein
MERNSDGLLQRKRKAASEREIASFLGFFYKDLQCQTSPNRAIEAFRAFQ